MRMALLIVPFLLSSTSLFGQAVISRIETSGDLPISFSSAVFNADVSSFSFRGPIPDDPLGMLQQEDIQKELNLSDDQIAMAKSLKEDGQRQASEIFRAQAKFGGDAMAMMQSAQKAVRKELEKNLTEILEPKQMKRLGQLEVQMKLRNQGVRALAKDRLAESLEVTDEQKEEIKEQARKMRKKLQAEYEKLQARYRSELIKKLLSKDQLTKLEAMSGDEYDVKPTNIRR